MNNMKIIKFALFERNDIDIIDNIDNLYKELSACISDKRNIKEVNIMDDELYVQLNNFRIPIYLCFGKLNRNYSFGKILVDDKLEIVCLWIPLMDSLKHKSPDQLTFKDLVDNFHVNTDRVKHELTHIYDYIKYKRSGNLLGTRAPSEYSEKEYDKYFNDDLERNAYFIQKAIFIKEEIEKGKIEIIEDFDVFMTYMKLGIGKTYFDSLNRKNKKKYISRCYNLYEDLRKKYLD